MTSSPLFIIDAESIVIFCPMLQFGCFRACASVACSISALAQVRNGPPEAVMMTRTSSSRLPEPSAWNSALCSESAGRMQAPAFAARCMKKSPAHTRHSLFASATVAPRSTAASAGFSPAAPLTAAIIQYAGRAAASMMALSPAPHSMRVPARASFNSASRPGSATAANRAPNSFASLARSSTLVLAVKASTRYRSREARSKSIVLSPIEPVAPRTVTARTADAGALLLRNGTALIFSPNHKTAADAIHAVPQKTENRRQHHCRDKAVETIEQPAMARNDSAGVLDAETAFNSRFKEIAELGNNG